MRTQKRAKSISFGKTKEEATPKPAEKEIKISKVEAKKVEEKVVKETKEPEETKGKVVLEEPAKEAESKVVAEAIGEIKAVEEASELKSDVVVEKEPKEKDSLEKDLESLKESEAASEPNSNEANAVVSKSEDAALNVAAEETKEPEAASALSGQKEDTNPFTVKSAFSTVDGLYDKKKKSGLLFFFLIAGVSFVLGLAVMAGADYWMKQSNVKLPNITNIAAKPSPTTEPTKIPKPTEPSKNVDVSAVTVRVLNGSGVKGEAAKVKATLTKAGFTVTGTGNADEDTYKKTEIIAKKSVDKAVVTKLQEELSETYVVASPTAPTGTQTSDIVVIIGSSTK